LFIQVTSQKQKIIIKKGGINAVFQSNNADAVIQSNPLIGIHYDLPLEEQRLILTLIARIQPDDEDFKPYRISISELSEFIGKDKNSAYIECKQITKSLLSRVIEIAEPGRLVQTRWISSAQYIERSGMITLRFAPMLKPYLLKLKETLEQQSKRPIRQKRMEIREKLDFVSTEYGDHKWKH
jgi:plasmid replication initiation protein